MSTTQPHARKLNAATRRAPWILLAPFLVLFALTFVLPILTAAGPEVIDLHSQVAAAKRSDAPLPQELERSVERVCARGCDGSGQSRVDTFHALPHTETEE